MDEELKVLCHHPTPGKKPTRISKWKYELVRTAILAVVPVQGIEFNRLPQLMENQLSPEELERL